MLFQNRGKLEIHLQAPCGPCIPAGVGAPALLLLVAAAQVTVAPGQVPVWWHRPCRAQRVPFISTSHVEMQGIRTRHLLPAWWQEQQSN